MHGHTVGPTDLKLGMEDHLSPVKVLEVVEVRIRGSSQGCERFSAWRIALAW